MANHLTGVHVGERAFRAIGGVMNEISCEQIAPALTQKVLIMGSPDKSVVVTSYVQQSCSQVGSIHLVSGCAQKNVKQHARTHVPKNTHVIVEAALVVQHQNCFSARS